MRDPVVIEMFRILTVSKAIVLLHYTIILQDVTIG